MESGPATGRPLVLVCDDEESIRRLMRINLEFEGFEVEEAGDGHAAMARLIDPEATAPDVIVLDAQMGQNDGWWTIAAIRSHPRMSEVPVVMVTASVQVHDRVQATEAGLDAFLGKPFDPDELVDVVSRFARGGRTRPPAP